MGFVDKYELQLKDEVVSLLHGEDARYVSFFGNLGYAKNATEALIAMDSEYGQYHLLNTVLAILRCDLDAAYEYANIFREHLEGEAKAMTLEAMHCLDKQHEEYLDEMLNWDYQ